MAGFPILLHDSMESCVPANDFFRSYLQRGAINSDSSWSAAGQSIYDFFSFIEAHDLDWRDVDRGEKKSIISAYRDYCAIEHNHSTNTIRLRLFYISEFYDYAENQGLIANLPSDFEIRVAPNNEGFFAHLNSCGNQIQVNSAMPRKRKNLPKYLTMHAAKELLHATENTHHYTLIKFALQTGLRRMELATFPVAYIRQGLRSPGKSRNVRLRLNPYDGSGMKTKGNRVRELWVSRDLLLQMDQYITQHRGQRVHLGVHDSGRLFSNHNGHPYANKGKAIERIVRDIGKKIGLDVHPHMLRHTYATHTLVSLQRFKGDIEPLVFVSRQLGHESIETTKIYLHLVDDYVDNAVLEYDEELTRIGFLNVQEKEIQ